MTTADESAVGVFERKILRSIYGPLRDADDVYRRRYNDELYELYADIDIVQRIKKQRPDWLGHVVRMGEDAPARKVFLTGPTYGGRGRGRGRPQLHWKDQILLLTASTAICISSSLNGAYDDASDTNNKNIFYAARQRLSQQQQLQSKQHDDRQGLDGNFQATKSYNSNNDNNNNMKYKNYLEQQQLKNALVRVPESHAIMDEKSKGIAKRKSTRPEQADRTGEMQRNIHTELDEVLGHLKQGQHTFDSAVCDTCSKTEIRNPYEDVDPGKQENNSENSNKLNVQRRSPSIALGANSAISTDDEDLDMDLPYGIQNVRKRGARQNLDFTRSIIYQSLCPTKRTSIPLETSGYEYRPNQYIEVTCAHQTNLNTYEIRTNKVCSEAGFSCIQLNRTIHLIRRNKLSSNECWESEIRIVPSGCECMWPKHDHGDITVYHRLQKRFGGYANEQANSDYEEGEGLRQIRPQQNELFNVNGLRRNDNGEDVGFEVYEYPN